MVNVVTAYGKQAGSDNERVIRDYAYLVNLIAHQMMSRLPASVQVNDLIQVGLLGLLDAASKYEDGHSAMFETYARQRIKGAMLDELREADWVPRGIRSEMRKTSDAINHLQQALGREPGELEIADQLQITLAEYQKKLTESCGAQLMYYEDFNDEDNEDFLNRFDLQDESNPLSVLEDDRFKTTLEREVERLPEREKIVMGLIYEQEVNLKEIGLMIGVSESRVSQLHTQAVARLRARLRAY